MRATRLAATVTTVATLALAGCASSGSGAGGPASSPHPVHVGAGDDGQTVHVVVGQTITLRLTSTYWHVAQAAPAAVLQTGDRATRPAHSPGCVPGQGCGAVTARFTAARAGRAVIAASRTSCGEALRCSPAQGSYRVRVVVQA
jgi:hypothetical protein